MMETISNDQYHLICETLPNSVLILDESDNCVYANARAQSLFEYSAQDMEAKPFLSFCAFDAQHTESALADLLQSGKNGLKTTIWPCKTRAGRVIASQISMNPVTLAGVKYVIIAIADINILVDKQENEKQAALNDVITTLTPLTKELSDLAQGMISGAEPLPLSPSCPASLRDLLSKMRQDIHIASSSLTALFEIIEAASYSFQDGQIHEQLPIQTQGVRSGYETALESLITIQKSVREPFSALDGVLTAISNGDFSLQRNAMPPALQRGDWVLISDLVLTIVNQNRETLHAVAQEVDGLERQVESISAISADIAEGADMIMNNAEKVSANAEYGKESVQQVLRAMEDLSVTVADVSTRTEEVSGSSAQADKLAKLGTDMAQVAEDGMRVIKSSANDMDRIIKEIQDEMNNIGKIVDIITEIAGQTNLLALNAAIEAARAGDAGRGFAVVAAEVKDLSQQSRASAGSIAAMISSLQKKSEAAAGATKEAIDAVSQGSDVMEKTLVVFSDLVKSVDDISTTIERVAGMTEEQAATVEEITGSVNEVSHMMVESANEALSSTSVTKETSTSVNELNHAIHELTALTKRLVACADPTQKNIHQTE
jgi:methyl-accepting chemotaxis protein